MSEHASLEEGLGNYSIAHHMPLDVLSLVICVMCWGPFVPEKGERSLDTCCILKGFVLPQMVEGLY